jgi:hypothetical protein
MRNLGPQDEAIVCVIVWLMATVGLLYAFSLVTT